MLTFNPALTYPIPTFLTLIPNIINQNSFTSTVSSNNCSFSNYESNKLKVMNISHYLPRILKIIIYFEVYITRTLYLVEFLEV